MRSVPTSVLSGALPPLAPMLVPAVKARMLVLPVAPSLGSALLSDSVIELPVAVILIFALPPVASMTSTVTPVAAEVRTMSPSAV